MEPLDTLQIAIKNNIKVFYFATKIPMEILFAPDGKMERNTFLATWKDISPQNEAPYTIQGHNIFHLFFIKEYLRPRISIKR